MTLWILFCKMTETSDILYTFYAKDREDAERQASKIVSEQGYEARDLKAYPYGFVIHHSRLVGTLDIEEPVASKER